jgi:hypothetical protein|tara:strand:- start:465 stop:797 length:333 start_codon:yes stop_codon:yes gene_type:complete
MADKKLTIEEELLQARTQIIELKAGTKTSLSSVQFLTLVIILPLFLAFISMGIIIVYKTTSSPATVAPHLDIILLAFSIFSAPCVAAAASLMNLLSEEVKTKAKGVKDEE